MRPAGGSGIQVQVFCKQQVDQFTQVGEEQCSNAGVKAIAFPAADGEQAWEILTGDEPVSLVVSDLTMPKLDGLEFVKRVRAMDKYKETPIFMITSEAAKYNVVEAVKAAKNTLISNRDRERLRRSATLKSMMLSILRPLRSRMKYRLGCIPGSSTMFSFGSP